MRESHFMPDKVKTLGKLTLHPFEPTFGGSDPKLKFRNDQKTFRATAKVFTWSSMNSKSTTNGPLIRINHSPQNLEYKTSESNLPKPPTERGIVLENQNSSKKPLDFIKEKSMERNKMFSEEQ